MASISNAKSFLCVSFMLVHVWSRNFAYLCHALHQPVWKAESRRPSAQLLLPYEHLTELKTIWGRVKIPAQSNSFLQWLGFVDPIPKPLVHYEEVFIMSVFSYWSLSPTSNHFWQQMRCWILFLPTNFNFWGISKQKMSLLSIVFIHLE